MDKWRDDPGSLKTRKGPSKDLEGPSLQCHRLLQQQFTAKATWCSILKSLIVMGCFMAAKVTSMQWLLLNVAEFGCCYLHVYDVLPTSFSPCCFKENVFSFMLLINVSYNKNIVSKASVAVLWLFSFFNAQLFWNMFQLCSASILAWERCINWPVSQQVVSVSYLSPVS